MGPLVSQRYLSTYRPGWLLPIRDLTELVEHRDLLSLLITKELKIKYKGTTLGFMWSLLNPLLMMVVYTAIFSVIARFPLQQYPIYLLSGLLPWTAFAAAVTGATLSIILNGHLVRRVKFPNQFLPITSVAAGLVNLIPSLGILLVFVPAFGRSLGWPLLALPLLLLLQAVFTAGIALILSAVTVYFRDLEHLIGILVTVWFFATPIIYPLGTFSGHRVLGTLLLLNPMTWLISGYQAVWYYDRWPEAWQLLALAGTGVALWVVGALVFGRLQRRFAEEV